MGGTSIACFILSATKGVFHFGDGLNTKVKLKAEGIEKPSLKIKGPKGKSVTDSSSLKFNTNIDKPLRWRRSRMSTEQLVPSSNVQKSPSRAESLSDLRREVYDEDLNLRVLLLSPFAQPTADLASSSYYEKSNINLFSHSGSVTVEVIRLTGADKHHFRLDVTSIADSAHVILPPKFRGNISIDSSGGRTPVHATCSAELHKSMDKGDVRLNSPQPATVNEDDVHIRAAKNIKLTMAAEAEESRSGNPKNGGVWILERQSRYGFRLGRIGRMFKMP